MYRSSDNPDRLHHPGGNFDAVTSDGTPLHNAVVWLDPLAQRQAEFLQQAIPEAILYRHIGISAWDATCPICKLLWFKENKPEIYHKTAYFLLLEDYPLFCLTGRFITECSLLSTTGYYDIYHDCLRKDALDCCGLEHCRADFVRSILESVGYMLRENMELMQKKIPCPIRKIFSSGGGSRSPLWGQIKADILNLPLQVPRNNELTACGAALLALERMDSIPEMEVLHQYLPKPLSAFRGIFMGKIFFSLIFLSGSPLNRSQPYLQASVLLPNQCGFRWQYSTVLPSL